MEWLDFCSSLERRGSFGIIVSNSQH
jgi:hypothetical protein